MNEGALSSLITANNINNGTIKVGSGKDNNGDNDSSGFIIFIVMLLLIIPMFIGWDYPTKEYTIEMTLVNSQKITETYVLPNDAHNIGIDERRGSYCLTYSTNSRGAYFNLIGSGDVMIRAAVIDFKIKSIK